MILESEISIKLHNANIKFYRNKGYVVKNGIEILVKVEDLPKGSSSIKLTKICDEPDCNVIIPNKNYWDILKAREKSDGKDRCPSCTRKYIQNNMKMNINYEQSLEFYALQNNKKYLLDEFSLLNKKKPNVISFGTADEYLWICPKCKSEYPMKVTARTSSNAQCPFCAGRRVNYTNCIWTTHPEIAKLLFNQYEGYVYTSQSNKKVDWKCPDCGNKIENKQICEVTNQGLSCSKCSDGVSYPEKFMSNMLDQLYIKFEYQKSFIWSIGKRFDFYIQPLNCIIETHGEQHYRYNGRGRNLEEEQENDRLKEKLANENGIGKYIVIDCMYSRLDYMKNNILNSELATLFNFDNIDWLKCHEFACNSLVKTACEIWNDGIKSTFEIGKILKLSNVTIMRYLKQGKELGWCEYIPQLGRMKKLR